MKRALGDTTVRAIIFDHYQEIITDDKKRLNKNNKTLALRQIEDKITKKERFRFEKHKSPKKLTEREDRKSSP